MLEHSGISRLSEKCSVLDEPQGTGGRLEMSQVTYALLIAISLTLTGYFGWAAWHASGDDRVTTGAIARSR
jgi:hypothetical protein